MSANDWDMVRHGLERAIRADRSLGWIEPCEQALAALARLKAEADLRVAEMARLENARVAYQQASLERRDTLNAIADALGLPTSEVMGLRSDASAGDVLAAIRTATVERDRAYADLDCELKITNAIREALSLQESGDVLAAVREAVNDRERLLKVARGCHDYGGGYRGDDDISQCQSAAFHHGIATVVQALSAAVKDPTSLQVRVLEQFGEHGECPNCPNPPHEGKDRA